MIQVWNSAAAELFGYLPEEAVGHSLDIIIPEHLRPAHWEGMVGAIENRGLRAAAKLADGAVHRTAAAFPFPKNPCLAVHRDSGVEKKS